MSIFQFRRTGDDGDLRGRLEALERSHQELARKCVESQATIEAQLDLIWFLGLPRWLSEEVEAARSSGWTVEHTALAVVFHRLEDGPEHSYRVPWPLPEDSARVERMRWELHSRIRAFQAAA